MCVCVCVVQVEMGEVPRQPIGRGKACGFGPGPVQRLALCSYLIYSFATSYMRTHRLLTTT